MDLFEIADEILYHYGKSVPFTSISELFPDLSPGERDRVVYLIEQANVNISWPDNI